MRPTVPSDRRYDSYGHPEGRLSPGPPAPAPIYPPGHNRVPGLPEKT